MKMRRILFSKH